MTVAILTDEADRKTVARRERFRCHAWLRKFSKRVGATQCMTSGAAGSEVEVSVTASGATHVSGIRRCGSPHSCPVCAPVVRERRSAQIDVILKRALDDGYHLVFLTATIQHSIGWALADTLEALQKSWTSGFGGRAAQWRTHLPGPGLRGEPFERHDYVGQIRALDFTHSSVNGWHPHIHAVLFFHPDTTAEDRADWLLARRTAYRKALQRRGYHSAANSVGWHWSDVTSTDGLSDYAAKVTGGWGAALELARGDMKTSRHIAGVTPFDLLRSAALDGDLDDAELFSEYEAATNGRRAISVGRRIKELFGTGIKDLDADDSALAESAPDTDVVYVKSFRPAFWNYTLARGRTAYLLEAVADEARRFGFLKSKEPPDTP